MHTKLYLSLVCLGVTSALLKADTFFYVSPDGGHIKPFADWSTAATDLAGEDRVDRGGRVDMGCYESIFHGSLLLLR